MTTIYPVTADQIHAGADRLRRDIGDLRLALRDVPPGGASGDAPRWLVRLHRAACEVAGIGVRESAETPPIESLPCALPTGHILATSAMPDGGLLLAYDGGASYELQAADGRIVVTRTHSGSVYPVREPPETPHPHDQKCSRCRTRLVFSARQRGDGLCGPCSREASGQPSATDRIVADAERFDAYREPADPRIGMLCRPHEGDGRIARVIGVEPDGKLRVWEDGWGEPQTYYLCVRPEQVWWLTDAETAEYLAQSDRSKP